MSSSLSASSLLNPFIKSAFLRTDPPSFNLFSNPFPINPRKPKQSLSASIAQKSLELSWVSPDPTAPDDYNGWAIVQAPPEKKHKGLPAFLLIGIGTSVAAFLAAVALSRKGIMFQFENPLHGLQGLIGPSVTVKGVESENELLELPSKDIKVSKESLVTGADKVGENKASEHVKMKEAKLGRIVIPVAADSTQKEAILMLKKLKIIEEDVKADELCTRREYGRWLVKAISLLERSPRHRIVPSVALSGSTVAAFDDLRVEDPDFASFQSLAEAGIVPSKLSGNGFGSGLDDLDSQDGASFFPGRYISRQDLISWIARLNYGMMPAMIKEVSRNNIGFLDAREISLDAVTDLFMDVMAGDKGIVRKVFGQIKRFQPNKPCTKAQVAVALTSGRMAEAIQTELSRLEAENASQQTAMEELRFEILERGYIQRYWEKKLKEERSRGLEVEKAYLAAVKHYEDEKIVQENSLAELFKERAVMDCQKQLLSRLREEVNEMSERLSCEMAEYVDEQNTIQDMLGNLQSKYEGMLDTKSILEAEIEALRILRSWIEDEARKSQARAKVLEEVGRRWTWNKQS